MNNKKEKTFGARYTMHQWPFLSSKELNWHCCSHHNNALLPSQNCLPSTPKDAPLVVVFIAKTKVRIIKPLESTSSHSSMLLSFYSFVFPWSVETESEKVIVGQDLWWLFFCISLYILLYFSYQSRKKLKKKWLWLY